MQATDNDVSFISQAMALVPTFTRLRGQRRSLHLSETLVWPDSLWIYRVPVRESKELSEHVEAAIEILESRSDALRRLRARSVVTDLCCYFSSESGQGSVSLSAKILQRIAAQNIDMIIGLYPAE